MGYLFQVFILGGAALINMTSGSSESVECSSESERLDERVTDLQERVIRLETTLDGLTGGHGPNQRGIDCSDVQSQLGHASGVYSIWRGDAMLPFDVVCLVDEQGPWTLIQRRVNGDVNFLRNWTEYRNGFGNLGFSSNFWLGLEKIHQITSLRSYVLRVDLKDWDGQTAYEEYANFYLDDEDQGYAIHYGDYSGTAGDSLDYINGMSFSTPDVDNDLHPGMNCGMRGGWWYMRCSHSDLNGIYRTPPDHTGTEDGIQWLTWKSGWYSAKQTTMRIRPIVAN